MQKRTVRLALDSDLLANYRLVFSFAGADATVRSVRTGKTQSLSADAAKLLLDELKIYGWKEVQ